MTERDLDPNLARIEVVPQDVTRVFLNLIGNGFYAADKRSREGDGTFHPVQRITTREVGDSVEIRVRDNGIVIPPEHREKLFQPFTVWLSIPLLLLSGLFIGQAVIALLGCAVCTICQ